MFVETRVIGERARPLDGWAIPTPPGPEPDDGGSLTLRDLIARVVRSEVSAFEKRERARRLMRVLSEREISEAAIRGKVDSGGRSPSGTVDENLAVAPPCRDSRTDCISSSSTERSSVTSTGKYTSPRRAGWSSSD